MVVQGFFHLPVVLSLLVLFHSVFTQYHRDTREDSIFGMMLQNHIFKTITRAAFGDECLRECYHDIRCQSFNYVFTQDKCELSNRTKEARPEDFVPNSERYYFRRDMNRGKPSDQNKKVTSYPVRKQNRVFLSSNLQSSSVPFQSFLQARARKSRPVKVDKRSVVITG